MSKERAIAIFERYAGVTEGQAERLYEGNLIRTENEQGGDFFWGSVVSTEEGEAVEIYRNGFIVSRVYSI